MPTIEAIVMSKTGSTERSYLNNLAAKPVHFHQAKGDQSLAQLITRKVARCQRFKRCQGKLSKHTSSAAYKEHLLSSTVRVLRIQQHLKRVQNSPADTHDKVTAQPNCLQRTCAKL